MIPLRLRAEAVTGHGSDRPGNSGMRPGCAAWAKFGSRLDAGLVLTFQV